MIGYIYVIKCKDLNDTSLNYYIGSTKDLRKRENSHRSACNNQKDQAYNCKVYQYIRSNKGWDNFVMYPLHQMEYIKRVELHIVEQKYINLYKPELNEGSAVPTKSKENKKRDTYHNCECGGTYTKYNRNTHFNTKKHLRYVLVLSSKSTTVTIEAMNALSI